MVIFNIYNGYNEVALILTRVEENVGDLPTASLARDNSPSDRVGDSAPLSTLLLGESRLSSL